MNKLFDRLLGNQDFRDTCKMRWKNLRETLWMEDYIIEKVAEMYEEIKDILKFEAEMFDPSFMKENWEYTIYDSVDNLFEWIPKRLEFCDSYFEF